MASLENDEKARKHRRKTSRLNIEEKTFLNHISTLLSLNIFSAQNPLFFYKSTIIFFLIKI